MSGERRYPSEKRCTKCGVVQPASAYNRKTAARDGLQSWCKSCIREGKRSRTEQINAQRRTRYATDAAYRIKVLAANRARAERDPEYTSTRNREYRERDLMAARAKSRSNYWSDPERARADARRRYYADKASYMERNRKRKARLAGNGVYEVTDRDIRRLFARCEGRCTACGSSDHLHLDHVIPVARGGRHSIGNLTVLCRRCNASKKHRTMVEWRYGRTPKAA